MRPAVILGIDKETGDRVIILDFGPDGQVPLTRNDFDGLFADMYAVRQTLLGIEKKSSWWRTLLP